MMNNELVIFFNEIIDRWLWAEKHLENYEIENGILKTENNIVKNIFSCN